MSLYRYRFVLRTNLRVSCRWKRYVIYLLALVYLPAVRTDEHNHRYEPNEKVVLWMNTVGPYHNRQETHRYFSLPFCVGPKDTIGHYHETLGEALQGVELEYSGLSIEYRQDVAETAYCEIVLTQDKRQAFVYAVKNHYWYQMYIDDLPIWGIVGDMDEVNNIYYLWTHKKFDIGYNGDRIVDINLRSENKVALDLYTKIKFTYEVNWKESSIRFEDRFNNSLG